MLNKSNILALKYIIIILLYYSTISNPHHRFGNWTCRIKRDPTPLIIIKPPSAPESPGDALGTLIGVPGLPQRHGASYQTALCSGEPRCRLGTLWGVSGVLATETEHRLSFDYKIPAPEDTNRSNLAHPEFTNLNTACFVIFYRIPC